MGYDFLKGITLVDTGRIRQPKEKSPTGLTLRVFSNGEVYPSKELIDRFKLEYVNKGVAGANGIDIVDSVDWTPTAEMPRMILFGITPKTSPKVDLFGTCKYNDDNTPKASVVDQGTKSDVLLELVRVMGYLTDTQKYCDLEVVVDYPITTHDGLSYIPKTIERGQHKGEKTNERRENVVFYPVNTVENLKAMREEVRTAEQSGGITATTPTVVTTTN